MRTRGPWRVEGSRVVFTSPSGRLTSLRLDMIDLEASNELSRPTEPVPAQSQAKPEAKESVLVLSDRNVGRAHLPAAADQAQPAPAERAKGLVVASWTDERTPDGLRFRGVLENRSDTFSIGLRLDVDLIDQAGEVIESAPAKLGKGALQPGKATTFQIDFVTRFAYGQVVFKPFGRAYATGSSAQRSETTSPDAAQPSDANTPPA